MTNMLDNLDIKPAPDFERLRRALTRDGVPDRTPFYELFFDKVVKDELLGKPCLLPVLIPIGDLDEIMDNEVELWYRLGFDYVESAPPFILGGAFNINEDTAEITTGQRYWLDENKGSRISSRDDFEKHHWPDPLTFDLGPMEQLASKLRDGMAFVPQLSGIVENTTWAMGYESLSENLAEDPEFVEMVFDKVGSSLLAIAERLLELPRVGALVMGDDMGHKTATILNPKLLRERAFPWHRKIVQLCKDKNIPVILHSCGKVDGIMDDIIDIGFDAKHSFEDIVTPVTDAKRLWGDKISVLGGVDMDLLSRGSTDEVIDRTREILRECMPGGGYALGSGNSVANYIKLENYLAMLETGWKEGGY